MLELLLGVNADAQSAQKTSYCERTILKIDLVLCSSCMLVSNRLHMHVGLYALIRVFQKETSVLWVLGCNQCNQFVVVCCFTIGHLSATMFQGQPLVLVTGLSQAGTGRKRVGEGKPQHLFQGTITNISACVCL